MADSTVTIVGNLTRDPEIRYTTGGAAKASFGVAVSRRWQNRQSQEWEIGLAIAGMVLFALGIDAVTYLFAGFISH